MPKISPFLWFDTQAEEAANFYVSIFPNSKVTKVVPGPEGRAMVVGFELDGAAFTALNGGPKFSFDEAVSFVVPCETQGEIDRYWDALTADGGKPVQCGWLRDRFGLAWQVVPSNIGSLMDNPATAGAVGQALMGMVKLDKAALEAAAGL